MVVILALAGGRRDWRSTIPRPPTGRSRSAEQAFDTEILVDLRPVDPDAPAEELEMGSGPRSRLEQSGKPRERDGQTTAVRKDDSQLVVRAIGANGSGCQIKRRKNSSQACSNWASRFSTIVSNLRIPPSAVS